MDILGIGAVRAIRRDPLSYLASLARTPGGIVRIRIGGLRYINVSEPALITRVLVDDAASYTKGMALARARILLGDGLLTSEGDLHRAQARRVAPAFARRRIVRDAPTFARVAAETTRAWEDGATVDVSAAMTQLTLRVVVSTLLGSGINALEATAVSEALTLLLDEFVWLLTHPLGAWRTRLRTPRVRRFLAARDAIHDVVDRLVADHRTHDADADDVLSTLLGDDGPGHALVRDEAVTLLVAGHETTASWLTFTWLALAEHPDCAARLNAELEAALPDADAPVSLSVAERLPYLNAVLEEVLRLYPPAWGVGRRAAVDTELAGEQVRRGTIVSVCQHAMQRHPRFWDRPDEFDPERWLVGVRPTRGVHLPFGDGPRRCIAESFARAEACVVVATIARRWRLHRVDVGPVALDARITLRVHGALAMRVERR